MAKQYWKFMALQAMRYEEEAKLARRHVVGLAAEIRNVRVMQLSNGQWQVQWEQNVTRLVVELQYDIDGCREVLSGTGELAFDEPMTPEEEAEVRKELQELEARMATYTELEN